MINLALSFVVASLLSFRFSNPVVRVIYWAAAVWLGFVSFFFMGVGRHSVGVAGD
ncbi:MAG: hypothetical protein WDM87_07650 [Terracidiphilus sp.]